MISRGVSRDELHPVGCRIEIRLRRRSLLARCRQRAVRLMRLARKWRTDEKSMNEYSTRLALERKAPHTEGQERYYRHRHRLSTDDNVTQERLSRRLPLSSHALHLDTC